MKILSMPKSSVLILIVVFSFILNNSVQASIYMYTDKQGNQHFSERKENEHYELLFRSETNKLPMTFKNWKDKSYSNIHIPRNKTLQHKYHPLIVKAAQQYRLEPAFIHAVITAESAYKTTAVSSAGAMGLMQLMPVTAKRFGVDDAFNAQQNINAGSAYLYKLLKEFKTKRLALAAYNAGEGTVRKYNKQIPPYPETQNYVTKVMDFYWYYKDNL